MKKIKLTKNKYALVDDKDYEWLSQWKWLYGGRYYAARNTHYRDKQNKRHTKVVWMHREILKTPKGYLTDHINGNKLDNRRHNLRIVTKEQNTWNTKKPLHNTTGFKGVYWRANRWEAAISINNKKTHLGRFVKQRDAINAYKKVVLQLRGQYVRH